MEIFIRDESDGSLVHELFEQSYELIRKNNKKVICKRG